MKKIFILTAVLFTLLSCEKEREQPAPADLTGLHGVFIVNEGSFGSSNGAVSFLASDNSAFYRDVYFSVNQLALGDVVQSFSIYNNKGYIVVNNSSRVEAVNISDFKAAGSITGFNSPRYFKAVTENKAYVTDWVSNTVKIVDLQSLAITGAIPAGNGPEQIIYMNGKIYISNTGGFSLDSTVTVIDVATDMVIKTIPVGVVPGSMSVTIQGKIAVLCSGSTGPDFTGGTADDIAGSLVIIDPQTDIVERTYQFTSAEHPLKMTTNATGSEIYMLYGNDGYSGSIKKFSLVTGTFTDVVNDNFYGFGVHPATGEIYAGRYGFSANCWVLHYNSSFQLVDSVLAGIGPNSCVFY